MKKNLMILIMLSLAFYSCGNSFGGFDPRTYNLKPAGNEITSPDEVVPEPPPVPEGEDPFKKPENTNPDEIFDDAKFNLWNLRITVINNKNVPFYVFDTDKSSWTGGNVPYNEYLYSGPNIKAQGYTISGMRYYMYKFKNPVFKPDSSYNIGVHGERMERFYFYRFKGNAPVGPSLDNYVIAIDTYKKLIFAYAVPIKYQSVVGNKVPVAWGSVDNNTKNDDGGTRPFYEYDPIGYVTAEGVVTIYPWFISLLGSGKYDPIIDEKHTDVASAMKAGKSPYFVTYEEGERDPFREAFRNKIYSLRYTDENRGIDTLTLHSYEFSYDGNTLEHKTTEWFGDGSSTTVETFAAYEKVDENTAKYGGFTFKIEGKKLLKGDKHIGTDGYNEAPIFLDRVKGAKFTNDSFVFSDDGKTVTVNGDEVYKLTRTYDNKTRALYRYQAGSWGGYGFALYDGDNGQKDHEIWRTTWGAWNVDPTWVTWEQEGYRTTAPLPPAEDLFLKTVARKTYSLRDSNNTLLLNQYVFSSDGKTVTHNEKTWDVNGDKVINKYTGYTENTATTGKYNGTTFKIEGNKLYKDNKYVGTFNYTDPKPEFKDLQKGKTYSLRYTRDGLDTLTLHKYVFSSDGKKITYTTQKWLEAESSPTVFEGYEAMNTENAKYGGIIFNVKESDKNKLYKGVQHVGILNYELDPSFKDRVKGTTFKNGNKTWQFSEDGRTVKIGSDTYTHERSDYPNKTRGLYWWKNWVGTYYFYPFELKEHEGKTDNRIDRGKFGDKHNPRWGSYDEHAVRVK